MHNLLPWCSTLTASSRSDRRWSFVATFVLHDHIGRRSGDLAGQGKMFTLKNILSCSCGMGTNDMELKQTLSIPFVKY